MGPTNDQELDDDDDEEEKEEEEESLMIKSLIIFMNSPLSVSLKPSLPGVISCCTEIMEKS
jgi:hypothetical protein